MKVLIVSSSPRKGGNSDVMYCATSLPKARRRPDMR